MDIGTEFDAGFGQDRDKAAASKASGNKPPPSSGFCMVDDEAVGGKGSKSENILRFSSLMALGVGGRPKKLPLDWASVKALYLSFNNREKEGLGLEVRQGLTTCQSPRRHVLPDFVDSLFVYVRALLSRRRPTTTTT